MTTNDDINDDIVEGMSASNDSERLATGMVRAAKLLVEIESVRAAFREALGTKAEDDARPSYDAARRKYEHLMDDLASDPAIRPHLAPWMLDFNGNQPVPGMGPGMTQAKFEAIPAEEQEKLMHADVSEFSRRVRAWLEKHGANITDSGSGAGGWHLGAACTDAMAEKLCRRARVELAEYLDSGALSLSLHFWGWHFEKIRYGRDAREFLAKQSS